MTTGRFWREDPNAEWATLLRVVETYCHPDSDEEADERLRAAVRAGTPKMRAFKQELEQALRDPSRLPPGALSLAAEYDDGSDTAFLARLWGDLYPHDPPPA